MKTDIFVQARMGSERLPGKVLKEVFGKTLLEHEIDRLRRAPGVNRVIVATTTGPADDRIVDLCQRISAPYFRGSESNVLSRFYHAAKQFQSDVVIRICADCPLIDPAIVGETLRFYLANRDRYDYVSNFHVRWYPRGMDTEIFSFKVLSEVFCEAVLDFDKEHVTPFIIDRPERFKPGGVTCDRDLSAHRWTVDTEDDLKLITHILSALYPSNAFFGMEDVLRLVEAHPEWALINAHVRQKA